MKNTKKLFYIILLLLSTKIMINIAYSDWIKLECLIEGVLSGQCLFSGDKNACFTLRNVVEYSTLDGKSLPLDGDKVGITMVTVCLVEKDKAEVRGLTTKGINSRWGQATRDPNDKFCWIGSDFKICVWE